jgi:Flp pilus assembly protein TadG
MQGPTVMADSLRRRFAKLGSNESGMAAVEFAMLLPLMVTLYLGGVEISQAVSIDRKISLVARSVADLVAQDTVVMNAEMTDILNAGTAVAAPFSATPLKIIVSSVVVDANNIAKIAWSSATSNTTARTKDDVVTLPTSLKVANTSVIWAEVTYKYTPTIGYVITGPINLTDRIYMRPRLQDKVCRENVACT